MKAPDSAIRPVNWSANTSEHSACSSPDRSPAASASASTARAIASCRPGSPRNAARYPSSLPARRARSGSPASSNRSRASSTIAVALSRSSAFHARNVPRWNFTVARRARSGCACTSCSMLRVARTATSVASSVRCSTTQSACHDERVEHVEPTPVAFGQHRQQRVEQRQRLVVLAAGLGLPQRLAQRFDRLRVADVGRAHEVPGGRAVVALGDEDPRDQPVQGPLSGPPDPLVDRLLDQRVRDLVAQLPPVLGLVDQPSPDQVVERLGRPLERLAARARRRRAGSCGTRRRRAARATSGRAARGARGARAHAA